MNSNNYKSQFFFLSSEKSPSKIMQMAFDSVQRKNYSPNWIDFENLKSKILNRHDFIVLEKFDDYDDDNQNVLKYFEQERNIRIITPYIILYCEPQITPQSFSSIPMRNFAIFSQCMRGLTISCSNFPIDIRKKIEKRVFQMCGNFIADLNSMTSILVSDSVLTIKYLAAKKQFQIPVVSIDWIENCWNKYQYDFLRANDQTIISPYTLPLFHKLNITISGLSSDELVKIQKLIENNGGTYHSILRLKPILPNSLLILRNKQGDKYKYARKAKIPCVQVDWIYDSIKSNYALPIYDYDIDKISEKIEKNEEIVEVESGENNNVDEENSNSNSSNENDEIIQLESGEESNISDEEQEDSDDDEIVQLELDFNDSKNSTNDEIQVESSSSEEQEDSTSDSINNNKIRFIPKIMFSAVDPNTKLDLIQKVRNILKVSVHDDLLVSSDVTHFILGIPEATEKVFSAIAAGCWLLKLDYIFESIKAEKLLPIDHQHKWGSGLENNDNNNDNKITSKKSVRNRLMLSALQWKYYLLQNSKKTLFQDQNYLFLTEEIKSPMLISTANILRSGGAKIYTLKDFNDHHHDNNNLIKYALIDIPEIAKEEFNNSKLSPLMISKRKKLAKQFHNLNRLMSHQIISRIILEGPNNNGNGDNISIDELEQKYSVSLEQLKFYLI